MPRTNPIKTEYRTVCANYGKARHSQHAWKKPTLVKAITAAAAATAEAAELPENHHGRLEAPYTAEERTVSAWAPITE